MRVGQKVWYAKRKDIKNAEIAEYEKPIELRTAFNHLTIMPSSSRGFMEVMKYGEDLDNTWIGIANTNSFKHDVKEGDLFYLDGESPNEELEKELGFGASATATVKSVSYVNLTVNIVLTRNKDKVAQ